MQTKKRLVYDRGRKDIWEGFMTASKRDIRRIQLAQQILHLASKADWPYGHHHKEVGLSETLSVSRSPIRSALAQLVAWGAASKRPNKGYFLEFAGDELLAMGDTLPQTTEDSLYINIIDARIDQKLREVFTQADVMSAFSASRSVVEHVLWRMTEEGLLERLKGRGWQFPEIFDDFLSWQKGYEFRVLIEPQAILHRNFQIDNEKLTACRLEHLDLIDAIESGRVVAMWLYDTDSNFHELIASFSQNGFFTQAIQYQNRLRRMMEYRGYSNRNRVIDWCNEHLAIIDELERSRFERAAELMRVHLQRAADTALMSIDNAPRKKQPNQR